MSAVYRAVLKFIGFEHDDQEALTRGKVYAAFDWNGGISIINDRGEISGKPGPAGAWEVQTVSIDGEIVYQKEQPDGDSSEGGQAAHAEAGSGGDEASDEDSAGSAV